MDAIYNFWLIAGVAAAFAGLLALSFRQRSQILALARLTFLDAIRKKVLVVFVLFALVIIAVSQFFPVFRTEDRLRVVETICFWSMSTFGMIVAIFVAALSLPSDLNEKTIYTVATKPVRRGSVILGKALGFAGVSAVILALMGGVSLIAIHYVDARVRHETHEPSALFARWSIAPSQQFFEGDGLVPDGRPVVTGQAHSAFIWFFPHPALFVKAGEPVEVALTAQFAPQPGYSGPQLPLFVQFRRGEKWCNPENVDVEPGHEWRGVLSLAPEDFNPASRGSVFEVSVGPRTPFEFHAGIGDVVLWVNGVRVPAEKVALFADGLSPARTRTWLKEAATHKAVWVFRNLKRTRLPGDTIEGFADELLISAPQMIAPHMDVRFAIEDPQDPKHVLFERTVTATRERPTLFSFPAQCIRRDGTLRVAVERVDKSTYLGIPDHIAFGLYARHGSFDWNFAKALAVIFFQLVLLSGVALAGSTFLSAPVSVMFAFFVFFCGNLIDFMRNAATILSWSASPTYRAPGPPATFWQWAWDGVTKVIEVALPAMAKIMPDLQQFDVTGYVTTGDEVPLVMLINALAYFGAFGIFVIVVGQIAFRKKQIA